MTGGGEIFKDYSASAHLWQVRPSQFVYVNNLQEVHSLDAGPAMATMYEKIDPTQDAWIFIEHSEEPHKLFKCI